MAARRWSGTWGGLWVTDVLSLTTDNRCFSPGLIAASIGRPYFATLSPSRRGAVELLLSTVQQPVDSILLKVCMSVE